MTPINHTLIQQIILESFKVTDISRSVETTQQLSLTWSGVSLYLLLGLLLSTGKAVRTLTHAGCPNLAAMCRGVSCCAWR